MRTTIYLVRHAEAQSNTNPHHVGEAYLTEDGIVQAQRVAKRLENKNIEGIYVSEVLRARLTTEEISRSVGRTPIELGFLKERSGTYSADMAFVPNEPFNEMKARITEAKGFLENVPEGQFVVVSHAIFIKALLATIMLGKSVSESIIMEISDSLVIDNATISKLIYNKEKKKWRIMTLNCPA